MNRSEASGLARNALLQAFPADVRKGLEIHEEDHESHHVLFESDSRTEWLFFPHRGTVISLTLSSTKGATVEIGIVGDEGFASPHPLMANGDTGSHAVVQVAGWASRVALRDVRALMESNAVVRDLLMLNMAGFLTQVSQHALCNRLHSIEQRLAKWLSGVRDRIDSDDVGLTHDFLSHMLGTRRAGVTIALGALVLDGVISQARSSIRILDREALIEHACDCYEKISLVGIRTRRLAEIA